MAVQNHGLWLAAFHQADSQPGVVRQDRADPHQYGIMSRAQPVGEL
jgi:hypothetical protein